MVCSPVLKYRDTHTMEDINNELEKCFNFFFHFNYFISSLRVLLGRELYLSVFPCQPLPHVYIHLFYELDSFSLTVHQ